MKCFLSLSCLHTSEDKCFYGHGKAGNLKHFTPIWRSQVSPLLVRSLWRSSFPGVWTPLDNWSFWFVHQNLGLLCKSLWANHRRLSLDMRAGAVTSCIPGRIISFISRQLIPLHICQPEPILQVGWVLGFFQGKRLPTPKEMLSGHPVKLRLMCNMTGTWRHH